MKDRDPGLTRAFCYPGQPSLQTASQSTPQNGHIGYKQLMCILADRTETKVEQVEHGSRHCAKRVTGLPPASSQ